MIWKNTAEHAAADDAADDAEPTDNDAHDADDHVHHVLEPHDNKKTHAHSDYT